MELLLETFCLINGIPQDVEYHSHRLKYSLPIVPWGIETLTDAIAEEVYKLDDCSGRWRASVTYSPAGVEFVRLNPYTLPKIEGLSLVPIEQNFYSKKWADRSLLEQYKHKLPIGVEPLFVLNDKITDTTFTNILLQDGNELYTPKTYLLPGTKRAKLITGGIVKPIDVGVAELERFDSIHLINALLEPTEVELHLCRKLFYKR